MDEFTRKLVAGEIKLGSSEGDPEIVKESETPNKNIENLEERYKPSVKHKFDDLISDKEDKAAEKYLKDVGVHANKMFKEMADKSYEIAGPYRGPALRNMCFELTKRIADKYK